MTQVIPRQLRNLAPVLALGLLISILPAGNRVQAVEDRPTLFGFATHWDLVDADVNAITAQVGKPPAFYQSFWSLELGYPDSEFIKLLDSYGRLGMTPYIELFTDDLDALLSGQKDAELDQIVRVIDQWVHAAAGRYVLVAPLPESNLLDHPWGGDPAAYQAGYTKIRNAFLAGGVGDDKVRFVFAMNGISAAGLSYEQFYPGDAVVDIVGFSKLNRGGSSWRDYAETFTLHIEEMQQEVTRLKPILITQTGSVDNASGGQEAWLNDMFTGLQAEQQVIGAIYFNRDKDFDYRIVADGSLAQGFASGYAQWDSNSDVTWIFDGRMDAWVEARASEIVFDDIGTSPFANDILWVAQQQITLGCAEYRYCPDDPVTRAQMASFLARALNLPASSTDWFGDDNGSSHEANINAVAQAGITLGCGGSSYCGSELVTRAQMATFLARALNLPPSPTNWFGDDNGSTHEAQINKVADAGITLGCGTGSYCPGDVVTRGQMAAFLHRALG